MASSSSRHDADSSTSTLRVSPITIQAIVDSKLDADFDAFGSSFDYAISVRATQQVLAARQAQPKDKTSVYQLFFQKVKFIQPFGCLLALDAKTCKVVAYSENAGEMLTMGGGSDHDVQSAGDDIGLDFGTDLQTIFTASSISVLHRAFCCTDASVLNPIPVTSKASRKLLYAMVHRVPDAIIIDFEPVKASDQGPVTVAEPGHSYILAEKAINRLHCVPRGSMHRLCDTMVQEVFELTGYDRVMAYKFHEDYHGEVISEITKPGLEPFLGVHYPATDIPQIARYLFLRNVVRMICDCRAQLVKVVQDEKFPHDITLRGSTLRGPHGCHRTYMENMNSVASLVMAVVVNESDEDSKTFGCPPPPTNIGKKLWGLIVCHNTSPVFVPCPIRNACKFLAQVFAVHVSEEMVMESMKYEKSILHIQTLLRNKMSLEGPLGIVSQSPTMKDLIKCDGAVLYYQDKFYKMGVTPSDIKLYDIMTWINVLQPDCAGFITDSLCGSAFPVGLDLADVICGMAAVRIMSKFVLLWFRSHIDAVFNCGGEKLDPGEMDDDGRKMHPRSSFKAFKEIVKTRSAPWKDIEINAIHFLQLTVRNMLGFPRFADYLTAIQKNLKSVNIKGMQEQETATAEMELTEKPVVPILGIDAEGLVRVWNSSLYYLTGLHVTAAKGKHLITLIEESSVDIVKRMLESALQGKEEKNIRFGIKTYGYKLNFGPVILKVDVCAVRDHLGHVFRLYLVAQNVASDGIIVDKFVRRESGYKAIMQNLRPLNPPIFGSNKFGLCAEWNQAMTELSGWRREDVIGKILLGEVFGIKASFCPLKNVETLVNLGIVLNNVQCCQEPQSINFGFFARGGKYVECLICTNRILDAEKRITGAFCFLQLASPGLMQLLHVQRMPEPTAAKRKQTVAYVQKQVRNPLSGILYSRDMSEGINLIEEHKQSLQKCELQLNKILDDRDIESMIDGYVNLQMSEFTLHEVLVACMSQVMKRIKEKGINLNHDFANHVMSAKLYGDGLRLQQVLSDFLSTSVDITPPGGHLGVSARLIQNTDPEQSVQPAVCFELRITRDGGPMPENMLGQMLGKIVDKSEDDISLFVSRKLLKKMNGDVEYLREVGKSTFIISLKFARAVKSED